MADLNNLTPEQKKRRAERLSRLADIETTGGSEGKMPTSLGLVNDPRTGESLDSDFLKAGSKTELKTPETKEGLAAARERVYPDIDKDVKAWWEANRGSNPPWEKLSDAEREGVREKFRNGGGAAL